MFSFTESGAELGFGKPSFEYINVNQIIAVTHNCGLGQ